MIRILSIPLALLILLAGAMLWSGGGVERRADFAFINRGDIHTLDLNTMSYMQDFRLTYAIREGLYNLDKDNFQPEPAIATRFDLSPDKKVYTFHLRRNAKWSNGDTVSAQDFVFSWRHFLTQPGEYTYLFDYVKGAREFQETFAKGNPIDWKSVGIDAPDDYTLRVTLNNPVPYLLGLIAFPPFYPRHERSMAAFRRFQDEDVMDPFERHMAAQGFDMQRATENELLDKLAQFAALNTLPGPRAPAGAPAPTPTTQQAAGSDLPFEKLSPMEKLARMLEKRFVRFFFDKKYTRPPFVVTNGAYILKEWDFARRLRLEKSPTYWDVANVRCDTIEMVVAEIAQSQLLMYETGVVDWLAELTGELGAELQAKGRTDVRTSDAFGTNFLSLLCSPNLPKSLGGGKNPLADVRVRQALAMSIDKKYIVDTITRMGELPARTYTPPDGTLPDFVWKPGPYDKPGGPKTYTWQDLKRMLPTPEGRTGNGPGLPYNPDEARRLLGEAGYPGGKGFPSHPILYNSKVATRRQIAQVVQEQWRRELGISLPLQGVEGKIFQPRTTGKDYFIATVSWYGDYADISTFTDKYKSNSGNNDSDYRSDVYDDLCRQAEVIPDERKRIELLAQAEHMLDTEVPIIPLYHYVNISTSRDNVHGVKPNPRNITIFKNVWVDRK